MKNKILIIDDEKKIRLILQSLLEDEGYSTASAENGIQGLEMTENYSPDLIILDMKMPGPGGEEVLKSLVQTGFAGKVIILTAFGSIPNAVEAIHSGAYDYITKPFDTPDLLVKVKRAIDQVALERDLDNAKRIIEDNYSFNGIVTNNSRMKKILEKTKRAAIADAPILIQGSSGTGKELFAKAIHLLSKRKNRSFVAVNCGAIAENLIESELFGYTKGAFTGANQNKKGLFEEADGGTLFLDEIGEMDLEAQVKLLRVTQSGEYLPVGSTRARKVNVRIVAATNKPLEEAVNSGAFREDLYYRINVLDLQIPDLSARVDDIPLLIKHFLKKQTEQNQSNINQCSPEALKILQTYNWPGNVRELQNVIAGISALSQGDTLLLEDLPNKVFLNNSSPNINNVSSNSMHKLVSAQKEATEKTIIIEAMEVCGHNQTKTAEYLGIGRRTLIRRLNKYGIK